MEKQFAGVESHRLVHGRFTYVFIAWAVLSMLIAAVIWLTPGFWQGIFGAGGKLPEIFSAIAWQFSVWGGINLVFGLNGLRTRSAFDRPAAEKLVKILGTSQMLNNVWLAMGLATVAIGWVLGSAGTVAHGVCVLVQAAFLVGFDRLFESKLVCSLKV